MSTNPAVVGSDDLFAHTSILPDDPVDETGAPLDVLHDREYRVRAYRKADDLILIRGAIRDQKPPGLYFPGDPRPLTIHHMQVDIEVEFPTMQIVGAEVGFETHPNETCPSITDHYQGLIGLSIARGFTHRVRELFGGPRGCTHTTALLQAMAPVAIQCMWSMRAAMMQRDAASGDDALDVTTLTTEQRSAMWKTNVNSCHVWAEDSETVAQLTAGGVMEAPVFAQERMVELGLKPEDWARRFGA